MRKIIFIISLFAIILSSCAQPVIPDVNRVIVKNSLWEDVPVDSVARSIGKSISRDVSASELLDIVADYNDNTLDDFLRVYYDEAPSLEDAPPVSVYVVHPITYNVQSDAINIPRISLVEDVDLWRLEATAQLLFIDHVPPPPIVIPPTSMYEWYALYVVDDSTGEIIFEDHCGWTVDEVWDGAWILAGGWRNADHYRETIYNAYRSEVSGHPGWTLYEHVLYTAP